MIDEGPGCCIFDEKSDFDAFFGHSLVGAKVVVVVDGHFPPPTQMPKVGLDTQPRPALDCIDTDSKLAPMDLK